MTISRTIAIALVGLSLGLGTTTAANAGRLTDAVLGVAKAGKRATVGVVGRATGLDSIGAYAQATKPIRDCVAYVSGGNPAKVEAARNYCIQAHNRKK